MFLLSDFVDFAKRSQSKKIVTYTPNINPFSKNFGLNKNIMISSGNVVKDAKKFRAREIKAGRLKKGLFEN